MRFIRLLLLAICLAAPASAQDRDVPYWASIRAEVLNMRVGPSPDYRVAWVYTRPGLPVKVIRVVEGWRLIEDPAGARGWVTQRLLKPERSAIVVGDGLADMRAAPDGSSKLKWRLQPGVVGALGECEGGWCAMTIGKRRGYVLARRLWGSGAP